MKQYPNLTQVTFVTLCLTFLFSLATSFSIFSLPKTNTGDSGDSQYKKGICTRNMPCKWAVCKWAQAQLNLAPDESQCLLIANEGCECPEDKKCSFTDVMEPGFSVIQYEYRCVSHDYKNPSYFTVKRGKRGSNKE